MGLSRGQQHNKCVVCNKSVVYALLMNSNQFKRWLSKQGCSFESQKTGSGHLTVIKGKRRSQLPMHGGKKQLGLGLIKKIKKDLGVK